MHPRVSLSAISTFRWDLDADLAFYERAGITAIGASLAKLEFINHSEAGDKRRRSPAPGRGSAEGNGAAGNPASMKQASAMRIFPVGVGNLKSSN